jgi:hypothetical protein
MRTATTQLFLAIVLFAVGAALWFAGTGEQQLAAAERTLFTLRYERAVEELDAAAPRGILARVTAPFVSGNAAGNDPAALALYWSGDYDVLIKADDPRRALLAADADFRAMRRDGGNWQQVVARLDAIGKRYADVLRTNPGNEEAAYNYEFILGLRRALMSVKQNVPGRDFTASGLSVHGIAGAPPKDTDAKKFRMIVPMMPDERQEAEEASRAGRKVRKG